MAKQLEERLVMGHRIRQIQLTMIISGIASILAMGEIGIRAVRGQEPIASGQAMGRPAMGFPAPVKEILPSPRTGDDSFIQKLSQNDARFEVVIGQGRLLTLERDIAVPGRPSPLVATGDPSIVDFEIVGPRHIRVTGQRVGITDLSIVPSEGEAFNIEVHVVVDLNLLRARLRQSFPDAALELAHMREHVVVEGQARDSRQVAQIVEMISQYLQSVQVTRTIQGAAGGRSASGGFPDSPPPPLETEDISDHDLPPPIDVGPDAMRPEVRVTLPTPQVINLIRVPGPQQVLLKVQVAELNRTALRQLGVNFLFQNNNIALGTNIGGGGLQAGGAEGGGLLGLLDPIAAGATAFGVFDGGNVNVFVDALRRNQVFKVLAEPTLVAMHGHEASFLSGGEFPIPVPQGGAATGAVTIQYREFGVGLSFVPHILDGETVRLAVAPEVSSVDFSLGITVGGIQVPALNTRRTRTVVELQQGQTLAVSGLLQVEMEASTNRIPGLGDLPHIGAMFRNNSAQRVEKELIILVTPHLVQPLEAEEVPMVPGADVCDPTDHEFYFKGRIEGRTGQVFRSTTRWDDPLGLEHRREFERRYIVGPYGYSP